MGDYLDLPPDVVSKLCAFAAIGRRTPAQVLTTLIRDPRVLRHFLDAMADEQEMADKDEKEDLHE